MTKPKEKKTKDETPAISIDMIATVNIRPAKDNRELTGVKELAANIKQVGLIHPILVFDDGKLFTIISGHRRFAAMKLLKMETIPCIVRASDAGRLALRYSENDSRVQLTPVQEAAEIEALRAEGMADKDIAATLGRPPGFITRRAALAGLCEWWRLAAASGDFPVGHLEKIASLPEETQVLALKWVNDQHMMPSHRNLDEWIARVTHRLAGVPWPLKDATIYPEAGACSACPRRTGANADLFGTLEIAGVKGDTCLDPACFAVKMARGIQTKVDALREANPDAPIFKRRDHDHDPQADRIEAGHGAVDLATEDWQSAAWRMATKATEGAVRGMFVAGNSAGQYVYAVKRAKSKAGGGDDEPKAKRVKMPKADVEATMAAAAEAGVEESTAMKQLKHDLRRKAHVVLAVAEDFGAMLGHRVNPKSETETFARFKAAVFKGDVPRRVAIIAAVWMDSNGWCKDPLIDVRALMDEALAEWEAAGKAKPRDFPTRLDAEMQSVILTDWPWPMRSRLRGGVREHPHEAWIEAEACAVMIGMDVALLRAQAAAAIPYSKTWADAVTDTWRNDELAPPLTAEDRAAAKVAKERPASEPVDEWGDDDDPGDEE